MSDDPKLEHLFKQAFAEAEPAPSLLRVVNEYSTYEFIEFPLIEKYVEAVEQNPSRGQALASALAKLDTLVEEINGELDREVHFKIDFDEEAKDYGPKNKYLFHSLLSGLSLKHRLTDNTGMYTAIVKGLDPLGYDDAQFNSQHPEVLVVGTCIQLLVAGSVIIEAGPHYSRSAELVAKNLKDQKAAGTVKDPHAIHVLELAISHAETGLKTENELDNVWDLLFPPKS